MPAEPVAVPGIVETIAAGRDVVAVWRNELDGVTFRLTAPGAGVAEYVKVYPDEVAGLLDDEVVRLRWAAPLVTVPRVLAAGPGWLHTAGLPGTSAVDPRWAEHPLVAARAIGTGLRRLHDALPVADFPFGRPSWVPVDVPPVDRLVVCHGDACAPNTLLADDGTFCAHVDLGDLGVADRWADLAIATMSLDWNFPGAGPGGFEAALLHAYGVTADTGRMAFYRRAWD